MARLLTAYTGPTAGGDFFCFSDRRRGLCTRAQLWTTAGDTQKDSAPDHSTMPVQREGVRFAMRWIASLFVVACGHAPPMQPPPVELPVTTAKDVAGTWVAEGELDWGYRMTIDPDGQFSLVID